MKTIEHYEVAGKIFNNKEHALKYEAELYRNLSLRARNLKIYYWTMLGYPGEHTAIQLINHFCHYHKFTFGQWKGKPIGEIMMAFPSYIKWCLKNISFFKLNEEEKALFNTSWAYRIGGTSWDITHDEVTDIVGDRPDYKLIEWEKQQFNANNR